MKRRVFLTEGGRAVLGLSLLPFIPSAAGRASAAESPDNRQRKILFAALEEQLPGLMEEYKTPGVSLALITDGKFLWRKGFGVKSSATKEPVDTDTVFEMASVSKTVFAYAVLKLHEKRVLELDTPLTKYIPDRYLEADSRLDRITARHVLTHTTGFQNWRSDSEPLAIRFAPGEKFSYSGEGFSYLQSVVTHLTGRVDPALEGTYEAGLKIRATDFDAYMKANLLAPFRMPSSGYLWNKALERHAAQPHDEQGKASPNRKYGPTDAARYGAAGGRLSTATEYARYLLEVIQPRRDDAFRLKRETLREMLRPHVKINETRSQALGWHVLHTEHDDFIQHGGGNPGFSCCVVASVKRKSGFVALTNADNGYKLIDRLLQGDIIHRFLGTKMDYPLV
jgi:CubicO group peptidase (beta-lactamase class C family)